MLEIKTTVSSSIVSERCQFLRCPLLLPSVASLESFVLKIGHDLSEMKDLHAQRDNEAAALQQPSNEVGLPDEAIVHEAQPLISAQTLYIE